MERKKWDGKKNKGGEESTRDKKRRGRGEKLGEEKEVKGREEKRRDKEKWSAESRDEMKSEESRDYTAE